MQWSQGDGEAAVVNPVGQPMPGLRLAAALLPAHQTNIVGLVDVLFDLAAVLLVHEAFVRVAVGPERVVAVFREGVRRVHIPDRIRSKDACKVPRLQWFGGGRSRQASHRQPSARRASSLRTL
jgi:hypothetical protein